MLAIVNKSTVILIAVMYLCICGTVVEEVHTAARSSRYPKLIPQHRDQSPSTAARDSRKREGQRVVSSHSKGKARKSDSAIILPRDKRTSVSRASTGNASVGRHRKSSSKGSLHSKSAESTKVVRAREEESIRLLLAERKRLEKENREKRRRLEELRKQEMMIEAAAKKGGG